MRSKLTPFVICCLSYAASVAQWSSPAPLLNGSPYVAGQSLVAGAGDTMWATVVSTAPPRVLACWTTGDTWSLPIALTPPDSNPVFHEPGMGRDASGRLWAAWLKDLDSSSLWAAFRDSAGWHSPARVYSGGDAAGPLSFASDGAGDWYLGFATLTPYLGYAYSSAVYCRLDRDTWQSPRYIARGTSDPFETNFLAPTLVKRPDSGLWAAYDMFAFGDSVAMLKILQSDTARQCWSGDGSAPAATADSSGRLWILYSQLGGFWLRAALIVDSVEVDTRLVSDYTLGRGYAATDFEGIVWAAWKHRSYNWVAVNYSTGGDWSEPEQTSAMASAPVGIAADANGRVYVLFKTADGKLYSAYRTSRPGVHEPGSRQVVDSRLHTVVRSVLFLPSSLLSPPSSLFSLTGRKVLDLRPGANDVSALSSGVYFVREEPQATSCKPQAVTKVVIQR